MFLRRYTRTKEGKRHAYYALVESVRTDAGPRQHVVAYLGELNHDQERRWQRTVVFYNREGQSQQLRLFPDDDHVPLDDDPGVVRIRLGKVGWTNGRRFGDVWLARWLWRLLGLDVIVERHLPAGKHTVRPADVVAIEVVNRLCAPCSEFALAEHWYAASAPEDLLGVPDAAVTKDRLYRTLDQLQGAKEAIENDLKTRYGVLFGVDYDLLLYDLTSSHFEGPAEDNDLARRGHSRDHRGDCQQVVIAPVVTRDGFPLAHYTLPGNARDLDTVESVVTAVERRFGRARGVWVMDRGMIGKDTVRFLSRPGRRYVLATRRSELKRFANHLGGDGRQRLADHPEVEVKPVRRGRVLYLLARSRPRRKKERAIRRRQRRGLKRALQKLQQTIARGRLKKRDTILERLGRLKERYPKAIRFVSFVVRPGPRPQLQYTWNVAKFRDALARDGAYRLRSNRSGWSATEFWETYMQLTVVERAFRVLKSEWLLRPIWHHYGGRTEAHVFLCVLAYALWKTLDHLAKRAGLTTEIRKPDPHRPNASPKPRPMTPAVILRELGRIQIGDILLETTDGRQLALRRVARPNAEQARILAALQLQLPERLSSDRLL
jgi:transposase